MMVAETAAAPASAPPKAAPLRVLICTADVGCGHGRAASALNLALRKARPNIEIDQIDALQRTPRSFNRVYRDLYLLAAKRVPSLTGWMYRKSDRHGISSGHGLGVSMEAWALRKLTDEPLLRAADVIVCTHFLCGRVLSRLRARGVIDTPLAVVVTDQHPHAVWRVEHADQFLVASDASRRELSRHGIAPHRVRVTGIPVDARFDQPLSREAARKRHEIPEDARVALITGGGLGLGGLDRALEGFLSAGSGSDLLTALVVCGRNEALFATLQKQYADNPRVRIIGLTQRMHEYMAAADVMVGKAGGLTTSEVTAIGVPMVLLRPLPGQEEYNATALVDCGAALLHPDPFDAGKAAAALLARPRMLADMKAHSAAFGRRGSAAAAADAVLTLAGQRRQAACVAHWPPRAALQMPAV